MDAVTFAKNFENLVYFGHALEILLHTVLEKEADSPSSHASGKWKWKKWSLNAGHHNCYMLLIIWKPPLRGFKIWRLGSLDAILPIVIQFLDQFPHALDVIVGCARKTEVALWEHLFSIVGNPQDLFEVRSKPVKLVSRRANNWHFSFTSCV